MIASRVGGISKRRTIIHCEYDCCFHDTARFAFSASLILHPGYSHSTSSQSRNRFVETALAYALTYVSRLSHTSIEPASITILADTDYYSCAGTTEYVSSSAKKRFPDFNVPLTQAHKTGLGSSAALVAAFTAAVLSHYLPPAVISLDCEPSRARLHNLAQASHCSAQGKVGSGFDVAAAVYGSCIYKRFSPSLLEGLSEVGTPGFSSHLRSLIEGTNPMKHWDTQINRTAVSVPKGLKLLMCDVDCGSETVGMVKNVLNWREDNPEDAALLWAALQKGNEDLGGELRRLANLPEHSVKDYENLRVIILTVRSLIREMSEKAGVPIEPRAQTDLLDACSKLSGVIGGVVPGAGGFDAIALLVEGKDEVVGKLHSFLDAYKIDATADGGAGIGKVRLLGVKQDMEGIKAEDLELYSDWFR